MSEEERDDMLKSDEVDLGNCEDEDEILKALHDYLVREGLLKSAPLRPEPLRVVMVLD